jgi:hypothetical protein
MTTHDHHHPPVPPNAIFVFGSNLAGRHGAGAALTARKTYGAIYGQATGLQGRSYAIPTKDEHLRTLPLSRIAPYVAEFTSYARAHPDRQFFLTRIGCGLAGYRDHQIAPLFAGTPANVIRPDAWSRLSSPQPGPDYERER